MKLRYLVLAAGLAGLAGCSQSLQEEFNDAFAEWRQTCFATPTNECANKLVDLNILGLNAAKDLFLKDADQLEKELGPKAKDFYVKTVDNIIAGKISRQEKMRPGFFARTILSSGEVLERDGNLPFGPEDMASLKEEILREVTEYARVVQAQKSGKKLTLGDLMGKDEISSEIPGPVAEPAAPEALPAGKSFAELNADQTLSNSSLLLERLNSTLEAAIQQQTSMTDAQEYFDARGIYESDIDGDGAKDAMVLYTLEGSIGVTRHLALLKRIDTADGTAGTRYEFIASTDVEKGASEVQNAGRQQINVLSLVQGPDDPDCCPSVSEVTKYLIEGNELRLIR